MSNENDSNENDETGADINDLEGFTPDQKRAIIKWQNSGTTARFAKVNKQVMKQVQGEMQTLRSEILESIKEMVGGQRTEQEGEAKPSGATDPAVEKRFAQMEREVQKARKMAEDERHLREEQLAKARAQEERSVLENALRAHGAKPEFVKPAVALLYTEEKRVARDDNGAIVFKIARDGFTDELDIELGVAEWLKTAEGKVYAAPRSVAGSGATAGKPASRAQKTASRDELQSALMHHLLKE
jgi:hypothetical protein